MVFGVQNWLIAIGGISRAIMIFGSFMSQRIALYFYQAEIIENMFMGRHSIKSMLETLNLEGNRRIKQEGTFKTLK